MKKVEVARCLFNGNGELHGVMAFDGRRVKVSRQSAVGPSIGGYDREANVGPAG